MKQVGLVSILSLWYRFENKNIQYVDILVVLHFEDFKL